MAKQRPTTRAERAAKEPATLPIRFRPRFLDDADNRQACVKALRQRLETLKEDAGVDCIQKQMLAEQAVFIGVQLETMQMDAMDGFGVDVGKFCNLTCTLTGILKALGLSRSAAKVLDLKTYIGGDA